MAKLADPDDYNLSYNHPYRLTKELFDLLNNLSDVVIDSKEQNYLFNMYLNNETYTDIQRTELNRIRKKYLEELKQYYR